MDSSGTRRELRGFEKSGKTSEPLRHSGPGFQPQRQTQSPLSVGLSPALLARRAIGFTPFRAPGISQPQPATRIRLSAAVYQSVLDEDPTHAISRKADL